MKAARRQLVLDMIRKGFGDAALSASSVAAALGVSPRYVHMLLDETGISFTQHLLDRRLSAARAMLADRKNLHLRISDIALATGFNDVSHFNRTFRGRFGERPSDVRARAVLNPSVD